MYYANHSVEIDLTHAVVYVDLKLRCGSYRDSDGSEEHARTFDALDTDKLEIEIIDSKLDHLVSEVETQVLIDINKDNINWRKE